ncbi:GNAT family N-acetyltransferase [Kaistia dalseonensis]|uniref:GNAT superfamily N-acetyltransferase n=1 Tax=Kaistia dalseonensis TaxID=410840 RepID=A0ABU0HBQ6_9HYPH|nr:GNAT family N-acetyltransferase [Kaistia dalseonensis]MCX5497118.1 GNAT family N-acetyltransferase [Kaistia dalseonensis]MDQ0439744.1 GNAT superfamily N-acetyltransferase [Kaistia dalseonensis]
MSEIRIETDPFPDSSTLDRLWRASWNSAGPADPHAILSRSLVHLGAYDGDRLVGYVNVAWDGGIHAFLLDPTVDPDYRRNGLGMRLVREAARIAADRGAHWLHVDYEPHLAGFYRACGFRPTEAGLMRLGRT